MSLTHHAPSHVRNYFPKAIRSAWLLRIFLWYAKDVLGKSQEQIAFLSSICSDDLNIVELPDSRMIGPFTLGGLDGYPFVGKTGIGAYAHHLPERGLGLMFFGPHLGITDKGQLGKVLRPGQTSPSDCCGAAQRALAALEAGALKAKKVEEYDLDDFQQESLGQIVLAHAEEILGAGPPGDARRFLALTEVMYRATKATMERLLSTVKFDEPAVALGGILINEDGGERSDVDLRTVLLIQEHQVTDITEIFLERIAERFKLLEMGNQEAFQ